jgi:arginyl-tRNA synthetase
MALLAATRQVLRNGLGMMGVSAPDAMAREAGSDTPAEAA